MQSVCLRYEVGWSDLFAGHHRSTTAFVDKCQFKIIRHASVRKHALTKCNDSQQKCDAAHQLNDISANQLLRQGMLIEQSLSEK